MNMTDAPMDAIHLLHERVELIVHLLKFSDRLFAIMSPATDELHTFTDLLIKEGGTGLLIARVHPDLALNAEDVATDLAKAWGIELNLGESAMQAIEQRLPERLPEPRRAVAIIEDAERLPPQVLDELIGFMQRLDDQMGGRVRLALLGGPNLAAKLRHIPSLEGSGQIYALHLTPPPAEVFADMASAAPGEAPLAPEHPAPRGGEAPVLPARALLIGGVAASLALAIVIALLLRPSEPKVDEKQQISILLNSETAASSPPSSSPPPVSAGEPAAPSSAAVIGHQLTDSPLPPPSPEQPPLSAVDVKPNAPVAIAEPRPSIPAATAAAEAKPSIQKAMPAAEPKPSLPAPKPSAPSAKKASDWYAQQKGDQYVLQVVSLASEAEVERFIKQHGLKDCHSFRQLRDGKTLHTLTCGLYPNRDAASQAAAKLPEKARVGKPFPRRIDDIRKIMQP